MDLELSDSEASFVSASECDWTEVRDRQFSDCAEHHKPCKMIDSSMLTIGEKIGEGGQAIIFEGLWHNGSAGNHAIKVAVKKFKMTGAAHTGPWPDEILKLKGGHLWRLHGYANLDDDTSLVMDRYECDLRSLIESRGVGSAVTNLSLIVQIALGMRCLHAHGVTHKDLKASNILVVDSTCGKVDVVIADFEISSSTVGSRFWRAPEILRVLKAESATSNFSARDERISRAFSPKSDVYSFGMTCYEVLTGTSPLAGLQACDYDAVFSGRRPDLPGDLNSKLCDLIHSCWRDAPDERPTFCEVLLGLWHVVAEMGLPVVPNQFVTCFHDHHHLLQPKLACPVTVSLFVEILKQYVKHYGWPFFLSYHFIQCPEDAVQVLKYLDHIEDRRCEIWRRLPDDAILQERCSNIKSIFVVNAASMVGDFELGEEFDNYVSLNLEKWAKHLGKVIEIGDMLYTEF